MTQMKHAKLSASSSERWLRCPGSVKAEESIPNTSSAYAQEGTLAHELADRCLSKFEDAKSCLGTEISNAEIEQEMVNYVQLYLDYVRTYESFDTNSFCEMRVDFSNVVPEGFGTSDYIVVDIKERTLHIFDLKYGKGVLVEAHGNTQLMLYAIGLLNTKPEYKDKVDNIVLHIVQPRMSNYDIWEISKCQLNEFASHVKDRAKLALSTDAQRKAGEKQCKWCRVKDNCKVLSTYIQKTITSEFENVDELEQDDLCDSDVKIILDNKSLIEGFLKSISSRVYKQLEKGEDFEGYKLVRGRSTRKWNNNGNVIPLLESLYQDKAFVKKLISPTQVEKIQGKQGMSRFENMIVKPEGKLTLVSKSDKRPNALTEVRFENFN